MNEELKRLLEEAKAQGASDDDLGKLIDLYEADQQASDGGASVGFTEGSQEPSQQPSQPSKKSGDWVGSQEVGYENVDPKQFETKLSADQEEEFQRWLSEQNKRGNITDGDYKFYKENGYGYNYDFRAAYKQGLESSINEVDNMQHWGDIGKKPNHPTFSDESKYHKTSGYLGGSWQGEKYTPPSQQPSQPSEKSGTKPSVLVEQPIPVGVAAPQEPTVEPIDLASFKLPNLSTEDKTASQVRLEEKQKKLEPVGKFLAEEEKLFPEIATRVVDETNREEYIKEATRIVESDKEKMKDIEAQFKILSGEDITGKIELPAGVTPEQYIKDLQNQYVTLNRNILATTSAIYDAKSEKGTALGAFRNAAVNGYTNVLQGDVGFVFDALAMIDPAMAGAETREEALKNAREAAKNLAVKDTLDSQLKDEATTEEYLEKIKKGNILNEGLLGATESVFAMATPAMSGFFTMAYKGALDEVVDKDLSETEKRQYATTIGLMNLGLERFGISKAVKGAPGVTQQIAKALGNKVIKEAPENVTEEVLQRAIAEEVKTFGDKFKRAADPIKFLNAFLAEAETGGLQTASEIGIQQAYNWAKEDQIFDIPDNVAEKIIRGAAAEGIGGIAFRGIGATVELVGSGKRNAIANLSTKEFDDLAQKIQDPKALQALKDNLQAQVNLDPSKAPLAQKTLSVVDEISSAFKSVPADTPNRKKVVDVMLDKQRLEKEAENAPDKTIYDKRIKKLNDQIGELIEAPEPIEEAAEEVVEPTITQDKFQEALDFIEPIASERRELTVDEIGNVYEILGENASEVIDIAQKPDAVDLYNSLTDKKKEYAIQEQAAGKVPVQPEAKASEKVEEGEPKAEPEITTEEGKATQEKIESAAKFGGVKAKNIRGLYDINRKMWGLSRPKALAVSVVQDWMIGQMAKREGVSKDEMYSKIQFVKGGENLPQGVRFQKDGFSIPENAGEGLDKASKAMSELFNFKPTTKEDVLKAWEEKAKEVKKLWEKFMPKGDIEFFERAKRDGDYYVEIDGLSFPIKHTTAKIFANEAGMRNAVLDATARFGLRTSPLESARFDKEIPFTRWRNNLIESFESILNGQKELLSSRIEKGIDTELIARRITETELIIDAIKNNYFLPNEIKVKEVNTGKELLLQYNVEGKSARGAMMMQMDGQAIIYVLTDPNVSTPLHEMAHVFEHYLTDAERKLVTSWAGTKDWTTETSEKFARGFEKYLAEGKAPDSKLQKLFDRFKEWLIDIYNGIKGSDIDVELNDKMRALYDKMLKAEEEVKLPPKTKVQKAIDKTVEGKISPAKKVTISEKAGLKKQIKDFARGMREAAKDQRAVAKGATELLKELQNKGQITLRQAKALSKAAAKLNFGSAKSVEEFAKRVEKTIQDVNHSTKLDEAVSLRSKMKPLKNSLASDVARLKEFKKINPKLVDDIDAYLAKAKEINSALRAPKRTAKKVSLPTTMNYEMVDKYIKDTLKELEEVNKAIREEQYQYLEGMDLSVAEMDEIISLLEEGKDTKLSPERKKEIDERLNSLYTFYKDFLSEKLDDESLSPTEKKIVNYLKDATLENLPFTEKVKAIKVAENILQNNDFSAAQQVVNQIEAQQVVKEFTRDKKLRLKDVLGVKEGYLENIASLTQAFKYLLKGERTADKYAVRTGITEFDMGVVRAKRRMNKLVEDYNKMVSKMVGYGTTENIVKRRVFSYMSRNDGTNSTEIAEEFKRRKDILEEQLKYLKATEGKYAEELEKALKDIGVAEATVPSDLKLDPQNKQIVDFFVNNFEDIYGEHADVALSVFNKVLPQDVQYLPDIFQAVDQTGIDLQLNESAYFEDALDTKESSMLKDVTKSKGLPKNNSGEVSRILNLDFDSSMFRKLEDALLEIETAAAVDKMSRVYNTNNLSKTFDAPATAVMKSKVSNYVNSVRGRGVNAQTSKFEKTVNKTVDFVSNFVATKLLGKLTQPILQTIPVYVRSAIKMNAAGIRAMSMAYTGKSPELLKLAQEYGTVSLRGKQSVVDIDSLKSKVKVSNQLSETIAKNLGIKNALRFEKSRDFLSNVYEKPLEILLENPDRRIAQSSWAGYYVDYMYKNNIEFDLQNELENPNLDAVQYANSRVSETQNESVKEKMGDLFTSKNSLIKILRNVIFPFANFQQNLRTDMYNNLSILKSPASSVEDKRNALRSLSAGIAETATFNALAIYMRALTALTIGSLLGLYGDEEEEEVEIVLGIPMTKKERRNFYTNIVSDYSLVPFSDKLALLGVERANKYIKESVNGETYDKYKDAFVYSPESYSEFFLNGGGKFGSAFDLVKDTELKLDMATDGSFTKSTVFGDADYPVSPTRDDIDLMIALQAMYLFLPLPREVKSASDEIRKDIETEAKLIKEVEKKKYKNTQ